MVKIYVVVGLCYGDEGKGTTIDFLSRQLQDTLIVRYNGGAQAAHNVVTSDGRWHTFSQFGSGMLSPSTKTHLSRFMLINPNALYDENEGLKKLGCTDALNRITIEETALVTTPFQQATNRIKESIYGSYLSGSCGKGIWETVADARKFPNPIRILDFKNPDILYAKLSFVQDMKRLEVSNIVKDSVYKDPEIAYEIELLENADYCDAICDFYHKFYHDLKIVDRTYLDKEINLHPQVNFEGAQGVLLDAGYGFSPYTTWTNILPDNAYKLLGTASIDCGVNTLGIFRTYFHRHGPGPLVTEDKTLVLPELHNTDNRWQKAFRVGYFDLVAAKYALRICRYVDSLSITHIDYLPYLYNNTKSKICTKYYYTGDETALLPTYFTVAAPRTVSEIIPQTSTALDREQQARMLFNMEPVYEEFNNHYLDYLTDALNIEISITSYGNTEKEKHITK